MDTPLIPRKAIFGNPDCTDLKISPDGTTLSWLAPVDGVLNLWTAPRDSPETGRPVTFDRGRGIHETFWTYLPGCLLYLQDRDGDENWRLYFLDTTGRPARELTPFPGTSARVAALSPDHPGSLVVALNRRDPKWHDLYLCDLATGRLDPLVEHQRFLGFEVDRDYRVRLAFEMGGEGEVNLLVPRDEGWEPWGTIPAEDNQTTETLGLTPDGRGLYLRDSRGRNTSALVTIDLATRQSRVLAEDGRCDAEYVIKHPRTGAAQAVSFCWERREWTVLDPDLEPHLKALAAAADGELSITARSLDDRYWTVGFVQDTAPLRFFLYDTVSRTTRFLKTSKPSLEGRPLAPMASTVIPSRDGLPLVSYYTLPLERTGPVPLVLVPHGGPWWRDNWGPNALHQWLSNRGYAVLSVNFRSSTGFGKAFVNAGNLEWGGKILEDQLDAVAWAVAQGWVDPRKLAVLGGSFGGYSTLAQLAFHPEVFACGVDLVGPSNLITLLESVPEYWKPMLDTMTSRIGDHRTPGGRELLARHSPLTKADAIRVPLLIGQGANDPRVKQAESDQIVAALEAKGIPVTYVLYPDEGHGFARPENNLSFFAMAEEFLGRCLGGRVEPVGTDFEGSSHRFDRPSSTGHDRTMRVSP